jgi:hypothetical protein
VTEGPAKSCKGWQRLEPERLDSRVPIELTVEPAGPLPPPVQRPEANRKRPILTGVTQWQDLFSDAITLYNWAVQQRLQGRIIASMNEKDENYRELQMPSLERAAVYAKQQKPEAAEASASNTRASVA